VYNDTKVRFMGKIINEYLLLQNTDVAILTVIQYYGRVSVLYWYRERLCTPGCFVSNLKVAADWTAGCRHGWRNAPGI
jgi:hypothetical protein